jgi:molybdopterin-containing oxidoreductase family iron-sulfur binding subunit
MPGAGLIFDLSLCYGCDACAAACRDEHLVPFDLSWITVEKSPPDSDGNRVFVQRLCMHCETPACMAACKEGALFFDEGRVVQLDDRACTGCGACTDACPYDVLAVPDGTRVLPASFHLTPKQSRLRADWVHRAAANIPSKCDLCLERRRVGRLPACVVACPVKAIEFAETLADGEVRVRFRPPR